VHGRVRVLKPSRPQLALQEDHSDQPVDSLLVEVVVGGEVARVRRGRLVVATGGTGPTARTDLHCVDSEHERLSSGGDGHSVDLKAHSRFLICFAAMEHELQELHSSQSALTLFAGQAATEHLRLLMLLPGQ